MVAQDRVAALLRSAGAPLGQPGEGWAGVQRRRQQRARRRVLGATGVAVVLAGTGIVVVPLTRGASSPPPAVISAGDPSPSQPGPSDGVQPAPSHQAGTTDVPLPGVQNIGAVALTADAVTLVFTDAQRRGQLEVRDVRQPERVRFRAQSTYPNGGSVSCAIAAGRWVAWVDVEPTTAMTVPGPPTAFQLVVYDLRTKTRRTVDQGLTGGAPHEGPSCPSLSGDRLTVVGSDVPGHQDDKTTYNLLTGRRTVTVDRDHAQLLPAGLLIVRGRTGQPRQVVIRDVATGTERTVRTLPATTEEVNAGGSRLAWWEKDPDHNQGLADPVHVRTCTLPSCTDVQTLSDVPNGGNGHVGDHLVTWAEGDSIRVVGLDGANAPDLTGQSVFFRGQDVLDDTLAWVSSTGEFTPQEQDVLHVAHVRTTSASAASP